MGARDFKQALITITDEIEVTICGHDVCCFVTKNYDKFQNNIIT